MPMSEPYVVDRDPAMRLVVQRGYATVSKDQKSIKYDRDSLRRLWEEWPSTSLVEFGRYWGIPYQTMCSPRYPFSVSEKRKAIADRKVGYRTAIVRRAMVPAIVDEASEIAALRSLLRKANQLAGAGLAYAHAKMVRHVDGAVVPNMTMRPAEAAAVLRAGADSMKIAASYAMIREVTRGDTRDEPTSRVKPEIVATSNVRPVGTGT